MFQPGDIAACYGSDLVSRIIQLGTCWPFAPSGLKIPPNHVAIIAPLCRDTLGWWESTTLSKRPCLEAGKRVTGVQVHWIDDRIEDYVRAGGSVAIYRLTDIDVLRHDEWELLHELLKMFLARSTPYDMIGAGISGLRVSPLLNLLPRADVNSVFCSELIAAIVQRLNRMNRENPGKYNPGRLLRECVRQGSYRLEHVFTSLDQLYDEPNNVIPLSKAA